MQLWSSGCGYREFNIDQRNRTCSSGEVSKKKIKTQPGKTKKCFSSCNGPAWEKYVSTVWITFNEFVWTWSGKLRNFNIYKSIHISRNKQKSDLGNLCLTSYGCVPPTEIWESMMRTALGCEHHRKIQTSEIMTDNRAEIWTPPVNPLGKRQQNMLIWYLYKYK